MKTLAHAETDIVLGLLWGLCCSPAGAIDLCEQLTCKRICFLQGLYCQAAGAKRGCCTLAGHSLQEDLSWHYAGAAVGHMQDAVSASQQLRAAGMQCYVLQLKVARPHCSSWANICVLPR